ncbi:MAG: sulfotransferase domain-containing protein [Desulfobacterales bacterium]|uniref:Sulfotransferase domain-containing protein n=1 Tax=Candidatus Desulfatibia vada TaxID=2841696 RepID=A0A8J6TU38_9BACT|nr:sulfotransferase domain-containing protein [Candidatus Desulfatibia vada]
MDPIVVVSGLPRSGTSMVMRIVEAGGLELIVDGKRKADQDNPKGYFEYEKVKELAKDDSWLKDISGKVVKIVSPLLYNLPLTYKYKIIFVKRHMEEILASQNKMLESSGRQSHIEDSVMGEKFEVHLKKVCKWIEKQKNIICLYVSYNEIMQNPLPSLSKMNEFLGGILDLNAMIEAIDGSLYRNRIVNRIH